MHLICTLTLLGLFALPVSVLAQSVSKGDIVIDHPWTRATPEGATVGAGYLKISNNGKTSDRLIGGTLEDAGKVEVHEMTMDGDVMKMRQLTDGLEIKPGATVELKPGSYHLMFMDLRKPIMEGASIKGTLTFEKAGNIDVDYKVEAAGASDSTEHMH